MESNRILVSMYRRIHKGKRQSSRCRTRAHSGGSSEKDVHIFVKTKQNKKPWSSLATCVVRAKGVHSSEHDCDP